MTQPTAEVDERDRDRTEVALAAAITTLLAARTAAAPWLDIVHERLSGIVVSYLQRAGLDMAVSSGLSGADAAEAASEAVDGVLGDVERHTASWLHRSAVDRAPARGGPMSRDQASEAAGIIARSLATYARERVREQIAKRTGAAYKTWQTRLDSAVRPGHAYLQGKTLRLGRPFVTEGHEIRYPGDPEAPLHLVVNCRCHLRYSVEPR